MKQEWIQHLIICWTFNKSELLMKINEESYGKPEDNIDDY